MSFQLMYQPLFVTPPPSPPSDGLAPLFGIPGVDDGFTCKRSSSVEPKMTMSSQATTIPPMSPDASYRGNANSCLGSRPSSPCSLSAMNATIVAVDNDKNSPHAVKWAIENLASRNQPLILVHVKIKQSLYPGFGNDGPQEGFDGDLQDLFAVYRGYSARKAVQMKEVILEERDVSKGLLDYIANNYVSNVVVGASSRNALSRKLKNTDVSASLTKSVPDFCSVFVISKGKVVAMRKARGVVTTNMPPRQPSPRGRSPILNQAEYNDASRIASRRPRHRSMGSDILNLSKERVRMPVANLSVDAIDFLALRNRDSISDCSDISGSAPSQASIDLDKEKLDFGSWEADMTISPLSQSSREMEAEMKKLKLELKQTMDLYSKACKEAITAKRKAEQLHQMKMEEERRLGEARMAEETALAIAEMEKARCIAAIDAAEKAQKLAEMEAQRRRHAEMKAKQEAQEKDRALTALHQNDARYRKYSIEDIEAATDKFSKSNKLGEGGYGPVYKGKLDHTPVAIKVLRPDAAQGKRQFHQEVEVLSSMRHPNMVLLLGACPEYGCLVYEYMDFGSLEDRLIRRGNTPPLSWRKRFDIAAEIATALLFMHQAKPEPLVHRDLKPANILLDRNFKSKISDVGLARLVPPSVAENVTQYHVTSAAGTFCYIDPEYQQTGKLTTKSDVYSLGILLLQMITAKSPMGLSHHIQSAIEKGKFEEMLDPTVTDWPVEEALAFAKVALACTELRKKDRPDLGTVVLAELNRLRDLGRTSSNSSHGKGHARRNTVSIISGSNTPRSRPSSPLPGGSEVLTASTPSAGSESRGFGRDVKV